MYTVQPSWQADAPADQEKHEVKFMYDDDGNPVMKKGAVDVNEWDSGPSKFNGQWAQFIMTDDDLSAITIKATIVADDATTWEYHPYDSEKTEEENVYIVFNFLASPSTVATTVPSKEINAQIEGTGDSGDGDSTGDGSSDDGSSDDGSSSDGSSDDGSSSDGSSSDGGSSKSGSGSNDNSSSGGSSNGGSSNGGSSNGSTGGSGTTSGGSTSGGSASGGSTGSGTGAAGTSGGAATSEETGAETMALAGLALAGAAIVISKKK